jgi:hypothetical protein
MKNFVKVLCLLVVLFVLAPISPVNALSCANPSVSEAYTSSDIVFSGKVTNIEVLPTPTPIVVNGIPVGNTNVDGGGSYSTTLTTFKIYNLWKGNISNTVIITTNIGFVQNNEYLIYSKLANGQYGAYSCSKSKLLSEATSDVNELNKIVESKTPTVTPTVTTKTTVTTTEPTTVATSTIVPTTVSTATTSSVQSSDSNLNPFLVFALGTLTGLVLFILGWMIWSMIKKKNNTGVNNK